MTAIFYSYNAFASISSSEIDDLKQKAENSVLRRARFCMHKTPEDLVHEMIIVFCKNSSVPIHKHINKCESFHVIEGVIDVCFYSDDGQVIEKVELGDFYSGKPFFFRHEKEVWHTVIPQTPFVVVHETTKGPFLNDETPILKF